MAHRVARSLREAAHSPPAFSAVYEATARDVLVFFARRTFDVEVARDLTGETFAQAFEHRRRFRGRSDAEAEAWLYGIARHQLSHYLRRGAVHRRALKRLGVDVPAMSEEDHHRIVEIAGLAELRRSVADVFATLPPGQQAALRLRVVEEHAYPYVAAELGISEGTARARVSRALRHIADTIETPIPAEVRP